MNVTLTVVSRNEMVLRYVRDFAKGLGCTVDSGESAGSETRIDLGAADDVAIQTHRSCALRAIGRSPHRCGIMPAWTSTSRFAA